MTAESMPQPSLTSQSPGADTQPIPCDEPPRNGRILTFYSYKGGTGRTMLLANLGWLLAAAGQRVLMIDWDFEAPGLHRYYRVFLDDPDLTETHGVDWGRAAGSGVQPVRQLLSLGRLLFQVGWRRLPGAGERPVAAGVRLHPHR